jgi:hypothetical protein
MHFGGILSGVVQHHPHQPPGVSISLELVQVDRPSWGLKGGGCKSHTKRFYQSEVGFGVPDAAGKDRRAVSDACALSSKTFKGQKQRRRRHGKQRRRSIAISREVRTLFDAIADPRTHVEWVDQMPIGFRSNSKGEGRSRVTNAHLTHKRGLAGKVDRIKNTEEQNTAVTHQERRFYKFNLGQTRGKP